MQHRKKHAKFYNLHLTAGRPGAIVKAKGLKNPVDSGRCLRHGSNLRIKIADALYLAGLREPVRETVSGTTIDVFLTPYQVRLFCTGLKKPGKAVEILIDRRHKSCGTKRFRAKRSRLDGATFTPTGTTRNARARNAGRSPRWRRGSSPTRPLPKSAAIRSKRLRLRRWRSTTAKRCATMCIRFRFPAIFSGTSSRYSTWTSSVASDCAAMPQKTHCARIPGLREELR